MTGQPVPCPPRPVIVVSGSVVRTPGGMIVWAGGVDPRCLTLPTSR